MADQSTKFDALIHQIEALIASAEAMELTETVALLRIVRIDLIVRANGVSEEELETFLFALESEQRIADYCMPPELKTKDGETIRLAAND